jgi:hypothetical protein
MSTAIKSAELSRPQPTGLMGQPKPNGDSNQPKKPGPAAQGADAIRTSAYFKWIEAGMPPGDGVKFWLEAENEFAGA